MTLLCAKSEADSHLPNFAMNKSMYTELLKKAKKAIKVKLSFFPKIKGINSDSNTFTNFEEAEFFFF